MDVTALNEEIAHCLASPELTCEQGFLFRQKALEAVRIVEELAGRFQEDADVRSLLEDARRLEALVRRRNDELFGKYRDLIGARGVGTVEKRQLLDRFTSYAPCSDDVVHYTGDGLDVLIDGVLGLDPEEARLPGRDPEMVHLERTPARVVLDLIDHVPMGPGDLLYDLGAGLGHVVILCGLLTEVRAVGIEIEPSYCELASRSIRALALEQVSMVNEGVLESDFGNGTIFFLFTPFTGLLLARVLAQLAEIAVRRRITICSHGNVTKALAREQWLTTVKGRPEDPYRLAVFTSR